MRMPLPFLVLLALTGCPKTDVSPDGAPASSSSTAGSASVNLAPIVDTSMVDPSSSAPIAPTPTALGGTATAIGTVKPMATASGTSSAVTALGTNKLGACCAALRKQAQLKPAQAAQFSQAATMCDGLVVAIGNAGGAPQLSQITPLLQGAQLPPVCQGL